jgi:hypothetical protein
MFLSYLRHLYLEFLLQRHRNGVAILFLLQPDVVVAAPPALLGGGSWLCMLLLLDAVDR